MPEASTAALIGLLGVLVGVCGTMLGVYVSTRREAAFRVREKITDRQITAYEYVLGMVNDLRTMVMPEDAPPGYEAVAARIPRVLATKEAAIDWQATAIQAIGQHLHWLDGDLRKYLMLLQNYLNSLAEITANASRQERNEVLIAVRTDFIRIATDLEGSATKFLSKQAHRFAFRPTRPKEYLTPAENKKWLKTTELYRLRAASFEALPGIGDVS